MTHEDLFLDTPDDLEARSKLGRGEYDALMMRRLLIDDQPLVDVVNRRETRRMKLRSESAIDSSQPRRIRGISANFFTPSPARPIQLLLAATSSLVGPCFASTEMT
jgi:hypothetical protein